MPAPTKYPDWATNGGGTVVEPPAGKVVSGWVPAEQPPSGWFNWWQGLVGQWVRWLEARANGVDTVLARAAYRDQPNTFTEAQRVDDLLTTETLKVTGAGVGAIFDHDVQVTGALGVSGAATVAGRLRASSATASLFDHDVQVNGGLTVSGGAGADVEESLAVGGHINAADYLVAQDVRARADFEYSPAKARSTIIPLSSALAFGDILRPAGGAHGIRFTTALQAVSFPIRLPEGATVSQVQVVYEKLASAQSAQFYVYRYHSITWGPTPALPTRESVASASLAITGVGTVTIPVSPALYISSAEDYGIVVASGLLDDIIHAVRVDWLDPGPRNH